MGKITNNYEKSYSDSNLWDKIKKFATVAGSELIYHALLLFYTLQKPETPKWAKGQIIATLGYFISPIDAIPDLTPVVGFADDLGVIMLCIAAVAMYIDGSVHEQAKTKFKGIFNKEYDSSNKAA